MWLGSDTRIPNSANRHEQAGAVMARAICRHCALRFDKYTCTEYDNFV